MGLQLHHSGPCGKCRETREYVQQLESELAAIRLAFPEGHSARTEGSIADAVRGLVTELHSLKYEANGQLRANISNAGIQSVLDITKQYMQERDTLRELLLHASWIVEDVSLRRCGKGDPYISRVTDLHQRVTAAIGTPERKP